MTYRIWSGKNRRRIELTERELTGEITGAERYELARIREALASPQRRQLGVAIVSSWFVDEIGDVHPAQFTERHTKRAGQRAKIRQRIAQTGRTDSEARQARKEQGQ